MTTRMPKPTALTTHNRLRGTATSPVRDSGVRLVSAAPAPRSTGAARRFLSVLMNSFSAWAV